MYNFQKTMIFTKVLKNINQIWQKVHNDIFFFKKIIYSKMYVIGNLWQPELDEMSRFNQKERFS